jgi:hypothetical protein
MPSGVNGSTYLISGICADECRLEIRGKQKLQAGVWLNEIQAGAELVREGALPVDVLSYGKPEPPSLDDTPSAFSRQGIRRLILVLYQHLNPVLVAAALLMYILQTMWLFRYENHGQLWTVLTGLLLFAIPRVALISFLDVSSLRIAPGTYLWEAFPIMLAFAGLGFLAALGLPWQSLRTSRA